MHAMVSIPPFSFTGAYFLFILSVMLTTLLILFAAGLLRSFRRKTFPTLRKKLLVFPLFVAGIFVMGWVTAKIQEYVYAYLMRNVATSILGIVITLVVAWALYDWVLWRAR